MIFLSFVAESYPDKNLSSENEYFGLDKKQTFLSF
jgi:hypothetical protein